MKRVLLTVAIALLIPGLLGATATMGVYFDGKLYIDGGLAPLTPFTGGLYIVQSGLFVTAVEYQLVVPGDGNLVLLSVSYPPNFSLELGDPLSGHSITFWPPLTGYPDGYDLMATYEFMTLVSCEEMPEYNIAIGPHPDTGELRGTYSPDNDFFPIIGLSTLICGVPVAAGEESWGAIKSLYR